MNFKPGQNTPLFSKYAAKTTSTQEPGDKEIEEFIQRVTQKLIPIYKNYPPNTKKVLYGNRLKLRNKLMQVVEGKIGFQKWFDEVRRDFGKHPVDLAQLLLEATEGLNSSEAKELRKGCEQFLQYIGTLYNPQLASRGGV